MLLTGHGKNKAHRINLQPTVLYVMFKHTIFHRRELRGVVPPKKPAGPGGIL